MAETNEFEIRIQIEQLQKCKLFVATPMYGGQCAGMYARSIADLAAACAKYGIQLQMYYLFNESLITRARNYCVDEFMRSGATHLMFIDSDIGFNPNDVLTLMGLQTEESDYDVIGGAPSLTSSSLVSDSPLADTPLIEKYQSKIR